MPPKKKKSGFGGCCSGPGQSNAEDAVETQRQAEGERRKATRREKERSKQKMAAAAEHMDSGEYDQAAVLYAEVAEKDPSRREHALYHLAVWCAVGPMARRNLCLNAFGRVYTAGAAATRVHVRA